jgi:hypothetical protein
MSTINGNQTKTVSKNSSVGMSFLLLFGTAFFILVGTVLYDNDAPFSVYVLFSLFMIAWLSTSLFVLICHIRNVKRVKGMPLTGIETKSGFGTDSINNDPMQRVRGLEELKREGLISEDEFIQKRKEIMLEKR